LAKRIKTPISIDTYKPEVAKQALDSGASMVNDISGLRNKDMIRVVSESGAAVAIMHMKGNPRDMQRNTGYKCLMGEVLMFLDSAMKKAIEGGVKKDKIIIDPGIGFAKDLKQNLEIISNLGELKVLGRPVLLGLSRKSFIAKLLGEPSGERLTGTLSACALAAKNGANILRVHDVLEVSRAMKVADSIIYC
jgi:dihydropteroate synthase